MVKLKDSLVYIGILASSVTGTAYGQNDVLGELPGSKGDTVCCISVDVSTAERARLLGFASWSRPWTYIAPFSEETLAALKDRGLEPEVTCLELVEKAILDESVWKMHLGSKSKRRAARPVLALKRIPSGEPDQRILFLDSDLAATVALPDYGDSKVISSHGEYVGIFKPSEDFRRNPSGKWEIFDRSGKKWGELKIPALYEGFRTVSIEISDSGKCVKVEFLDTLRVSVYDKEAKLLNTVKPCEIDPVLSSIDPILLSAVIDFSDDGRYLLLQVSAPGKRNQVILYGPKGKEIWRFTPEMKLAHVSRAWISQDGSYVISHFDARKYSDMVTYLLDRKGSVIRRFDYFSPTKVKFSASGNHVAFRDPSLGAVVLRLPSGESVFNNRSGSATIDFDFAEDDQLVAILEIGSVVLKNFEGRTLWRMNLPRLGAASVSHIISLSEDGKEMSLTVGNDFHVYRRVQFK